VERSGEDLGQVNSAQKIQEYLKDNGDIKSLEESFAQAIEAGKQILRDHERGISRNPNTLSSPN
jgi:hypothetical protein